MAIGSQWFEWDKLAVKNCNSLTFWWFSGSDFQAAKKGARLGLWWMVQKATIKEGYMEVGENGEENRFRKVRGKARNKESTRQKGRGKKRGEGYWIKGRKSLKEDERKIWQWGAKWEVKQLKRKKGSSLVLIETDIKYKVDKTQWKIAGL